MFPLFLRRYLVLASTLLGILSSSDSGAMPVLILYIMVDLCKRLLSDSFSHPASLYRFSVLHLAVAPVTILAQFGPLQGHLGRVGLYLGHPRRCQHIPRWAL